MSGYTASGPFRRRLLVDYLDDTIRGTGPAYAHSIPTGTAQTISLPMPPTGQHMLARMAVREFPPEGRWDDSGFTSMTPWMCVFDNVLVHGDGGIVLAGGAVVTDTMAHCEVGRQGYAEIDGGVVLVADAPPVALRGIWLSLLGGGHWNYYHWMIDGIGRMGAADSAVLERCTGLLLPAEPIGIAEECIARSGLAEGREVRRVAPMTTLAPERMVVPWMLSGMFQPHPFLVRYLGGLVPPGQARAGTLPRRLYVDRRGATNRALANEDEVITALAGFGVVAVRLEGMTLAAQAALFRAAELVVAPHGAGLANLVFASPGCMLVELLSDAYVHWCFRRLAATAGVRYDCVIGRALPEVDGASVDGASVHGASVHGRGWTVSATHVQAAVAAALDGHLAR